MIIILRKKIKPNRYRKIILDSIKSKTGNSVLICSGFFQEDRKFSAVNTTGLGKALVDSKIDIKTIGIHNGMWKYKYKLFRDELVKLGVKINAFVTPNYHWHSKIFILKRDTTPILGIIGSSNMTRNAFDISNPFNFETDVVIWDKKIKELNKLFRRKELQNDGELDDIIFANYDIKNNSGTDPMQRLIELENEINRLKMNELEP